MAILFSLRSILSRSSRWKILFIAFVFVGSLLTIFLAGSVPPQSIKVVNGQNYLSQTYAEVSSASIGYKDNLSSWAVISSSPNSTAQLNDSRNAGNISISGTFPASTNAVSIVIQKAISVNLTEYPLLFAKVNATSGIKYGIRLYSTVSNGSVTPIWSNTDALNHRPGLGQVENVQVNLELQSEINIGSTVGNVTKAQIYVERSPGTTPTPFTLTVQTFEFLDYNLVPFQSNATYHSVYFSFSGLPNVSSSWSLNKINFGLDLEGSSGTTYEIFQLNGTKTIPGSEFQYSPAVASYQYTLYPKNSPRIFPDTIPPGNNDNGSFSIVVVALSGSLSQVKLSSVSFVFIPMSGAVQTSSTIPGGNYWYLYLLFFIFLLPLAVALLLYDEYKHDNFKPYFLVVALIVGLACRFALAPITSHPFDTNVYATSARGWFEYGDSSASLGPTLPFTFFLYWLPYSFYALLLKLGFQDFFILNHTTGFVETIFLKAFPIIADVAIFYLLTRFEYGVSKLYAIFYFLNPLTIYVSSVWGQYEASTASLIVVGFLYLSKEHETDRDLGYLKASLAFVVSALIEIVGLIPLVFLFIKSLFSKPFKISKPLLVLLPLPLLVVYPPESHLIYLIYLAAVGFSSTLLLAQPHTPYTIIANFPQILPFHPLVISLAALLVVFLVRRRFELKNVVLFTFLSFVVFLLFAAQEPQWWVMVLPLGLLYAMLSEKQSLGIYMLAFGSLVGFLIFTFTQGSGYMLLGSAKYNLAPIIEDVHHGIDLYTVTTTAAALIAVGYVIFSREESFGTHTLLRASLILSGVFVLSYFWLSVIGVSL